MFGLGLGITGIFGGSDGSSWILVVGNWDDNGVWIDAAAWVDGA